MVTGITIFRIIKTGKITKTSKKTTKSAKLETYLGITQKIFRDYIEMCKIAKNSKSNFAHCTIHKKYNEEHNILHTHTHILY